MSNDHFRSQSQFDENRIRAAAVYCSDGRFGDPFDEFFLHGLGLPRYDRLAVPGGAACLAGHFHAYREEEGVINQLRFLIEVHQLEQVVLIAHQNCAFYSHRLGVSPLQIESQQLDDIQKAIRRVRMLSDDLQVRAYLAKIERNRRIRFEPVDLA